MIITIKNITVPHDTTRVKTFELGRKRAQNNILPSLNIFTLRYQFVSTLVAYITSVLLSYNYALSVVTFFSM